MNAFSIIEDALIKISAQDILIKSGATFDWLHDQNDLKPQAVNWAGAVLFVNEKRSFKDLLNILKTDGFWYYRFTMGFDRRWILSIIDRDGLKELGKDDISMKAFQLAKKYCK